MGIDHRTGVPFQCMQDPTIANLSMTFHAMDRSPGLHFGSRQSWSSRKHLNYMRDEACQVWGLRATIVAMRPLALTTP